MRSVRIVLISSITSLITNKININQRKTTWNDVVQLSWKSSVNLFYQKIRVASDELRRIHSAASIASWVKQTLWICINFSNRKRVSIVCTVGHLWISGASLSQYFQRGLALPDIKYNCVVLFLTQLYWLFIMLQNIFSHRPPLYVSQRSDSS